MPPSAGASIGAMIAFMTSLVTYETSEPLDTEGFKPPVDETSDPEEVG